MTDLASEPLFENEHGLDEETAAPSPATTEEPAEPAKAPEPAQTTSTENTEVQGSGPSGAEKRIQQLVSQREQERKRAEQEVARREELEREVEKLRQPVTHQSQQTAGPQPPTAPIAPEVDDYEDYSAYESAERTFKEQERLYIKDLAKYELLTELQQGQQQEAERRQAEESQRRQTQTRESFQSKVNKAFEDDPELRYLPVFTDQSFPLPQSVYGEVTESDTPVEVLRYLNDHREEAAKIATLPPNQIARAIGRIEASFAVKQTPTTKTVSSAPEPIQPIGGGSSGIVEDVSDEQFFAQEAAKFR